MAAAHSTLKARAGRNRSLKFRARGAQSRRSATPPIDREAFRGALVTHIGTLRNVLCGVITCCNALRYQAADADLEIATVLRVYCGGKLYAATQEAGVLLAQLGKTSVDSENDEITGLADPGGAPLP